MISKAATALLLLWALPVSIDGAQPNTRRFEIDYSGNQFLRDGHPFRYIAGCIHYTRVPHIYWKDRLLKLKAAGLNAIQTYIPWNHHELQPGQYDFRDNLDFVQFLQLAAGLGFVVVLRPGPFVDAGWDFGGLPGWLLANNSNILVRSSDPAYIQAVDRWFDKLLPMVRPLLYKNGGPIISVQVENEYGSYSACDFVYLAHLRRKFRQHLGDDVVLFTTDGAADFYLKCGTLEGLYSTVDFGLTDNPAASFAPMRKVEPQGPLVCSEFYTEGGIDEWGLPHHTLPAQAAARSLDLLLAYNASVSIYMFEGGTTFGFMNGGQTTPAYKSVVTSYDHDSPLTEAGDPTQKYWLLRQVIGKYNPLPAMPVPPPTPKAAYGEVVLKPVSTIFDVLEDIAPSPVYSEWPLSMEDVGQFYGYVLYRHRVKERSFGRLTVPGIHDRGYVMVNQSRAAILQHDVTTETTLFVRRNDVLDILVENMGRDFQANGVNRKGILGNVSLDGTVLRGWTMFALNLSKFVQDISTARVSSGGWLTPTFLMGSLVLPESQGQPADTFVDMRPLERGQMYVNGFHLGRYWPSLGPQVTLYVPGSALQPYPSINVLVALELDSGRCSSGPLCSLTLTDRPILNRTVSPSHNGAWTKSKNLQENDVFYV